MSNFPLYENMNKDIKSKDLTKKQKKEFITLVKKIDNNGAELLYALIRVHELNTSKGLSGTYKLPYSGTYSGSDITFDLESFPSKLKQILYKFITIHIKTMEERNEIV